MLERIANLPEGVVGLKAVGNVTAEDYEKVFVPILDQARRDGHHVRFLYQFGPDFGAFTPGGLWADAKVGLQYLRLFDGCAVVTDAAWVREVAETIRFLMPCPVKVFGSAELPRAVEWLGALPAQPALAHRILPEQGVLVVEVDRPLRAQDFDAVALTADTWIEAHGNLRGIVIHAHEFPGWESFGALVRHLQFIRDHHTKVRRIALATEGRFATLGPRIGEHFVRAEVKGFDYDDLDAAIAWAAGPAHEARTPASTAQPRQGR